LNDDAKLKLKLVVFDLSLGLAVGTVMYAIPAALGARWAWAVGVFFGAGSTIAMMFVHGAYLNG
jgi:hypothetical protein